MALSTRTTSSGSSSTTSSKVTSTVVPPMFVVFGRPGAGKTTIANAAVEKIRQHYDTHQRSDTTTPTTTATTASSPVQKPISASSNKNPRNVVDCLALDLDVCIPQWMKDNFGKGIYPTLQERTTFAEDACDYVIQQIDCSNGDNENDKTKTKRVVMISFSFVNTDMRDVFRNRFPQSQWILIDTTEDDATERIQLRQDHFYKGQKTNNQDDDDKDDEVQDKSTELTTNDDNDNDDNNDDNSEWNFAPVTFPHTILNGSDSIEMNAEKILRDVLSEIG